MLQAQQAKNTKPKTEAWPTSLRRPGRQLDWHSQERRAVDDVRQYQGQIRQGFIDHHKYSVLKWDRKPRGHSEQKHNVNLLIILQALWPAAGFCIT